MTIDPDHELDRQLRAIARALVAHAPDPPAMPDPEHGRDHGRRRSPVLMVAATVAVIGAAGLIGVQLVGREPATVSDPDVPSSGLGVTTVPVTTVSASSPPTMSAFAYVARPGQTLSDIAEDVCLTPDAIAGHNGWVDGISHAIVPSDVIGIPTGACDPSADEPADPSPTPPPSELSTPEQRYVVVRGDSIYDIATRFGITIDQLVAYNRWSDDIALFEGEVVLIPPGAAVPDDGALPTTSLLLGGPLVSSAARVRRLRQYE